MEFANRFPQIQLDEYIGMYDYIHRLIMINNFPIVVSRMKNFSSYLAKKIVNLHFRKTNHLILSKR